MEGSGWGIDIAGATEVKDGMHGLGGASFRGSAGAVATTRPISRASMPEMVSPVSTSRFVHCGPRWYSHMLVGGTPMERTGGKPSLASSAATTRSQCNARSVPPARQFPWTWAMTGSAQFQIRAHPSPRASIAVTSPSMAVCWGKSPGSASSAMKPYPEENDRPVLRMITTCTPASASASATAARISRMLRGVSGLCWSGRLSVRRRTRPISSTINVLKLAVTPGRLQTSGGT